MEAYLTAKEAAEYLKLAERTLVRLAHEGKVPGVKIGGQWRFRRALLDQYLDELASASVAKAMPSGAIIDGPLTSIFSVDQIIDGVQAPNREGVIDVLVDHCDARGLVTDSAWLRTALEKRERMASTAVPEGVAFLHARRRATDKFPQQFIALARSQDGIDFGTADMPKTNLFFLLALRSDALHLRWLSRLAWIVRNQGRLASLIEAPDTKVLHDRLVTAAKGLPGSLKPSGRVVGA